MPSFPRILRLPLLTALVMLASSWAGLDGEASACSNMKAGASCARPCGCCKPGAETSAVETTVEAEAEVEAAALAPAAIPAPIAECGTFPGRPCACRADAPSSPAEQRQSQPRPTRAERQERTTTFSALDILLRGNAAANLAGTPERRPDPGRRHVTIYLRDARLLF